MQDIVSMYHIELGDVLHNGHQHHGFVTIGSLATDLVKKTLQELELKHMGCTFRKKKTLCDSYHNQ